MCSYDTPYQLAFNVSLVDRVKYYSAERVNLIEGFILYEPMHVQYNILLLYLFFLLLFNLCVTGDGRIKIYDTVIIAE